MFHSMTDEDVADVVRALRKVMGYYTIGQTTRQGELLHALASRQRGETHV